MHTLLDCDGHLLSYVNITEGKTPNKSIQEIPF